MQRASTFAESRRHMTSLVAGLAALALAIAGQGYVAGRTFLYDGLFLYAIAVILAVRALDLAPPARDSAHDSEERAERAAGMQLFLHDQAGRTAAIVAVAANVLALRFFGNNNNLNLAWLLYAASVVVAPVAVWLLAGRPRLTIGRDWRPADALALAVVFVVAVFFRLYQIDSLPFGLWWDEAFSGLAALRILSDLGYRPVYEAGMAQEPSLLWYLMVPSVWLLGPQNIAIRLPAIVGGLTGVVATFLLARELFGQRTAVVASAFVAMMAWHVNFSRIGFNAIWSVTLDALATCFLIQALRTRRLLTFALAGTALGLGANMYYTTRLMPFILLIYLAHRLLQGRVTFIRQNATGLAVFVLVTLITVSPLGLYGIQHPKEFGSRADQVTIFKEMAERQSSAPLVESIRKHLAMFHYQGDPNGRHNLPGAPMLDRVIGGLFVVGLALAVRQVRQPRCSLLVTWTVVMLVGGIFSLGFEAPQGLRTIDEITGIAILAALPVATLWERLSHLPLGELRLPLPALGRWREPLVVSGGAIAVVGLVAWVGSLNYQRYFVEMARDFAVWNSFSTAETEIARQINTLSGEPSVYLGETFIDKPTIQFLATRARAFNRFDPPGQIPLRQPVNTAIFLEPEQERSVALLKRLYPRADLRVFASPYGGPPVLYTVIASAADIESLRGLAASYYAGLEWSGQPVRAERVSALDVDWTAQLPLTPPFSAEWRSTLATPLYGRYVFRLEAPEGSELLLDESPLVRVQAQGGEEKAVILPKGNHALRLRVPVSAPTSVRLLWQPPSGQQLIPVPADVLFAPPATNNGLLGSYYRNREWSGTPALQQIDPHLDLRFHILPLPRPYSIEWVGKIDVPRAGIYRFAVQSVDASSVFVDGNLVASNQGAVGQLREGAIQLTEGFHDIKVRYVDETTFTFVKVFWTPPGGQRVTLPSERLFPPQGAYRERAADLAPIAVTPPT
ncbi:MAG: glycosyltransferase family 39 protein, partial [Chloroflexi bacterium]|nr:glycosyltransferase family 39 protein [Chloroflexota bacterium]